MRVHPRTALRCLAVLLAFPVSSVFAVDGIAVSVKSPGSGYAENLQGSIERVDIEDDVVVKSRIIHSSANGFARLPCISQDGRRVCFFRDGDKLVNNSVVKGTTDYVSVITIDGANLVDLAELGGTMATNRYDYTQGGPDRFIDWPAGDWIYYQKPGTMEIWRVNSQTKVNEMVVSLIPYYSPPYIGRFNLSSGGNAFTYGNKEMSFPDTNLFKRPGAPQGCNHTISASGRFINGWRVSRTRHQWWNSTSSDPAQYPSCALGRADLYQGRRIVMFGHSYVEIVDWDWGANAVRLGATWNDYFNYRHMSYILGVRNLQETIGQPCLGDWSEMPRWAANSDKWLLHSPVRAQVLWNWADRHAVLGARNKAGSGQVNDAGDFWVKPPKTEYIGTHYEDHAGNWVPHGTKSAAPLPDYIRCPGLTTPFECALKYGNIVIMPQSVYNTIAVDGGDKGLAVLIPDISTIVVQAGSSIELTATNEYYDPIDPIFGMPPNPATVTWGVVGEGGSVSPATGYRTTLTTTGSFASCSVQVTITTGTVTKSVKKLAAVQAPPTRAGNRTFATRAPGFLMTPSASGEITVAFEDAAVMSLNVYRADGARVFGTSAGSGKITIPAGTLVRGTCFFRASRSDGSSARVRWAVR